MCGIVGYVGARDATDILLEGLSRLEYRGYDSAGIAVQDGDGRATIVRAKGKIANLRERVRADRPRGRIGIGHTRWATHGRPSDENAHPHRHGRVSVVHNGIIENHLELRRRLEAAGHRFSSETDTEIVAHLIDDALASGAEPLDGIRRALGEVRGIWALCVLIDGVTDRIFCARKDAPLVLGVGDGESFVASDIPSILPWTRRVVFLGDDEIAEVRAGGFSVVDARGAPVAHEPREITWSASAAQKEGFAHFMLKEIYEQPRAVTDTLRGRISAAEGDAFLDGVAIDVGAVRKLFLVACGTSHHACLVGKFMIEGLARLPVEVDLASEFRYRDPLIGPGDLLVAISQSGETADTLAALREAKARGARVIAIVNVVGSSIERASDGVIHTHAGPEIGVASTKAFTTQLAALLVLAVHLGRRSGALTPDAGREIVRALSAVPHAMSDAFGLAEQIEAVARRYVDARDWLFLGRGFNYPIALEAALKLKEISYVHAEGYAAGEMKHGPIALIDASVPVVVLAPRGPGYEKVMSNLQEVRSREGKVIVVATRGDDDVGRLADEVLLVPDLLPMIQPMVTIIPLQLLAYHVAALRGCDIDQPRNLAKSVTVE
ncbi:MAG: glutamine--fructose-6-phosphate transaminase (isomerizing) [Myxococcota bacterium]